MLVRSHTHTHLVIKTHPHMQSSATIHMQAHVQEQDHKAMLIDMWHLGDEGTPQLSDSHATSQHIITI